ncbi:MAG TPA: DUF72 domain-containing protein [Gammaproteobacteria bacterium]|nr:DUF72 domain-containing protein [Gammaproteobacteria bacterium]
MQNSLFPESGDAAASAEPRSKRTEAVAVGAAAPDPALIELAGTLPPALRLGTSSWTYPGWIGLVWDREYTDAQLARHGLAAYARHPLLRTVSLDRGFYRPLTAEQFAAYAAQVPDEFRFVVKAPALVTDAMLRDESGRGMRPNPSFLNATVAMSSFIEPAVQGLGRKLGALVFQLSPLPSAWLARMPELIERLHALLRALPDLRGAAPDGVVAVEVRDPQWLTPAFVAALRGAGSTYCMALHAKMPRIAEQLPILRACWPGPLVCRWNLNPVHDAFGYEKARRQYAPYDRLVDPDPETRAALARVIAGTVDHGQNAYVTLSNKAEGSAPLSVVALAQAVRDRRC